jgi:hypothetical protein
MENNLFMLDGITVPLDLTAHLRELPLFGIVVLMMFLKAK